MTSEPVWGVSPLVRLWQTLYLLQTLAGRRTDMSMEKRGVVEGENDAPAAKTAADEKDVCAKPGCCRAACGTDPLSKAAEAVADKTEQK